MKIVNYCPTCGAPIYGPSSEEVTMDAAVIKYTCDCQAQRWERKAQPQVQSQTEGLGDGQQLLKS